MKLNKCRICGQESVRQTYGPFFRENSPQYSQAIRCVNHCSRSAMKESWEEAEKDWNERNGPIFPHNPISNNETKN